MLGLGFGVEGWRKMGLYKKAQPGPEKAYGSPRSLKAFGEQLGLAVCTLALRVGCFPWELRPAEVGSSLVATKLEV